MDDAPIDPIFALKRQLADAILALSDREPVTVAARRLGVDAARLCDLRRGRIARFSVERLIRILATVDRSVELKVVVNDHARICWFPKLRASRDERLRKKRTRLGRPSRRRPARHA